MSDFIDRQKALKYIEKKRQDAYMMDDIRRGTRILLDMDLLEKAVMNQPSTQPEPLTDKEQRIFLAAMEREEKVCEEVDKNYVREPYEDSLMRVCKEIIRKVKGALWT